MKYKANAKKRIFKNELELALIEWSKFALMVMVLIIFYKFI